MSSGAVWQAENIRRIIKRYFNGYCFFRKILFTGFSMLAILAFYSQSFLSVAKKLTTSLISRRVSRVFISGILEGAFVCLTISVFISTVSGLLPILSVRLLLLSLFKMPLTVLPLSRSRVTMPNPGARRLLG